LERAHAAHEQAVAEEQGRADRQHMEVDQTARDFADGKRKAVADYFSGVLTVQRSLATFPTGIKVAYLPAERELRVDINLPLLEAIPELESADYLVTKKDLRYRKLTTAARNTLYQQVVARMLEEAVCNGCVDTVDSATGQDAHWCLVTVQGAVVGHPRRQLRRVGDRRQQSTAHAIGVAAAQQPHRVAPQVLDQRVSGMAAAEPVVERAEHLHGVPEPLHIAHPDPDPARRRISAGPD
jgi:hypothetical protein